MSPAPPPQRTAAVCERCGTDLEILHRPLRRLRGSGHWWLGVTSLFSQPLRLCAKCGSLYDERGELVATGAAVTEAEMKVGRFRSDMVGMRDGFGAVVIGSGLTVAWTVLGPIVYDPLITILAGIVGVAAVGPFGFFARRVRQARAEMQRLKQARQRGEPVA